AARAPRSGPRHSPAARRAAARGARPRPGRSAAQRGGAPRPAGAAPALGAPFRARPSLGRIIIPFRASGCPGAREARRGPGNSRGPPVVRTRAASGWSPESRMDRLRSAFRSVSVFLPAVSLALAAACSAGRAPATAPAPAPAAPAAPGTHASAAIPPSLRLEESEPFARAVEHGTRTRRGVPGPAYWQQYASYRLEAELNPLVKRLTGRGHVVYYNRSPDTLPVVYVQVYQNLFAPDAKRNMQTPKLGGMEFDRVAAQGRRLAP